jgi:hypothetical protein
MNEVIGFLGIVAAAVFVWALGRHHALKVQLMQHEERITAMQKGIEIPYQGRDLDTATPSHNGGRRAWFRLTVLGLALVFFFGGAGVLLAFRLVDDPEISRMWAIGLIPIMVSIGLFLFWLAASRELKGLEGSSE